MKTAIINPRDPHIKNLSQWAFGRQSKLLFCLVLFLLSVLLYSPAFKFEFSQYDDYRIIGEHPQLFLEGTFSDRMEQIFYRDLPREEPLLVRDFSWLLDSIVFGYGRPFGYHYGNVIYHSLALVLGFLLFLRLTNAVTAAASAILLLVLAVHVEPVAWIMGRKDILATVFSLSSILLFLRFQSAHERSSKWMSYLAALVLALAAFLSKLNAVVLPGVIVLCSLMANREFARHGLISRDSLVLIRQTAIQVLPFFVLALGVFLWYRSVLADYGLLGTSLRYSNEHILKLILVVDPLILLEYLKLVFAPWNLEAFYTSPSVFMEFSNADYLVAGSVILGLLAATVYLWRTNKTSCLLFLCFLVSMLPYGNWIHLGFWYANRYVYFASFFLVACVVFWFCEAWLKSTLFPRLVLVSLLLLTTLHNAVYRQGYLDVWRNGESIWTHEISLPGASIHDYNNLAANYIGQAQKSVSAEKEVWLEKALLANTRALELDVPAFEQEWLAVSHYQRGLILAYSNGPLKDQLVEFLTAVNSSTGFYLAYRSVGVVYYQLAKKETDPVVRDAYLEQAVRYIDVYFESKANDPVVANERVAMMRLWKQEFPGLEVP